MMKKLAVNSWVVLVLAFVSLSFGKVQAQEKTPQQPSISGTGKYQAIFVGEDKSGYRIILILNTETGKIEKRIFYDEINDKQEVLNYATKEIVTITRSKEEEPLPVR